tara:strand:- start:2112 stop:2687 length:576 start_codon:yes stop_codon:yes gene_type:complete
MEELIEKIGSIHSTCLIDGHKILDTLLENCYQMLQDRGCSEIEKTNNLLECMESVLPVLKGRGVKSIDIYFSTEERVGVKYLRSILEETTVDKIILCSLDGPTTFTKKESEVADVQFFLFKDLFVNITKHKIVPRHELCIDSIPYTKEEIPKISITDPIVQYYDFPLGSIIKIYRKFGSHEPTIYYRLICP